MTRQHVTVSLSGDAGDELFGGYNRYALGSGYGRSMSLAGSLRMALARMIKGVSPEGWNRLLGHIQTLLPMGLAQANIGDKLHKGSGVMMAKTTTDLYYMLVSRLAISPPIWFWRAPHPPPYSLPLTSNRKPTTSFTR